MASEEQDTVNVEPKLFVGQVPTNTSEGQIREIFGQHGVIKAISQPAKSTHEKRRFAMVTFEKWAAAEAAIAAIHGTHALGGDKQALVVRVADPPKGANVTPEMAKGIAAKKLFVGQIPRSVTDNDVRAWFQPFGEIVTFVVKRNAGSAAIAFVKFTTWAAAEAALEALHGTSPNSAEDAPLVVKFADGKGKVASGVDAAPRGGGLKRGLDVAPQVPQKRTNMGVGRMGANGMNVGMGPMGGMGAMPGMQGPEALAVHQMMQIAVERERQAAAAERAALMRMQQLDGGGGGGGFGMGAGGMHGMNQRHVGGVMSGMDGGGFGGGGGMGGGGGGGGMADAWAADDMMASMGMGEYQMRGSGGLNRGGMGGGMQSAHMGQGGGGAMLRGGADFDAYGVNSASGLGAGYEDPYASGHGGMSGMGGGVNGAHRMGNNSGFGGGGGSTGGFGAMGGGGGDRARMGAQDSMGPVGGYGGMGGLGGLGGAPPARMGGGRHMGAARGMHGGGSGGVDHKNCPWKLFVGQLPFDASEADLQAIFGQFGAIINVKVLRKMDGSKQSQGCGFVTFSNRGEAELAIAHVNGQQVPSSGGQGRPLTVHYAK